MRQNEGGLQFNSTQTLVGIIVSRRRAPTTSNEFNEQ